MTAYNSTAFTLFHPPSNETIQMKPFFLSGQYRQSDVVGRRDFGKDVQKLKRAGNSQIDDFMDRPARDIPAFKQNLAGIRLVKPGRNSPALPEESLEEFEMN